MGEGQAVSTLTVRVKGLAELKASLERAQSGLAAKLVEELRAGAGIVRDAAAATAGGGRLSGSYQLGGGGAGGWGTTITVFSDLIYAPVQEFAVVWGREGHSKRTGKAYHQTVHYRDPAVPRHLYPAFDANEDVAPARPQDGR